MRYASGVNTPDTPSPPPAGTPDLRSTLLPTRVDRDRAIETLTRSYADDTISLDEFERRTAAVFAARSTVELAQVVADLPAPEPRSRSPRAPTGAAPDAVPAKGRIVAMLSSNEGQGMHTVPRHLDIVARLGSVELDLRDAAFGSGVTEIAMSVFMGSVELTVPLGARVETTGSAILGSFSTNASRTGAPGADVVIRITGRAIFGSVETTEAPPTRGRPGLAGGRARLAP